MIKIDELINECLNWIDRQNCEFKSTQPSTVTFVRLRLEQSYNNLRIVQRLVPEAYNKLTDEDIFHNMIRYITNRLSDIAYTKGIKKTYRKMSLINAFLYYKYYSTNPTRSAQDIKESIINALQKESNVIQYELRTNTNLDENTKTVMRRQCSALDDEIADMIKELEG